MSSTLYPTGNRRLAVDTTKQRLSVALGEHAEDIALSLGALLIGVGVGIAFGYAFGFIVAGILAVAYGVWITERGA